MKGKKKVFFISLSGIGVVLLVFWLTGLIGLSEAYHSKEVTFNEKGNMQLTLTTLYENIWIRK